jgi:hypothetical protein
MLHTEQTFKKLEILCRLALASFSEIEGTLQHMKHQVQAPSLTDALRSTISIQVACAKKVRSATPSYSN